MSKSKKFSRSFIVKTFLIGFLLGLAIAVAIGVIWGSKNNQSLSELISKIVGQNPEATEIRSPQPTPTPSPEIPEITKTKSKFTSEIIPLSEEMKQKMIGVTWNPSCPVKLEELVLLKMSHWNTEGKIVEGELIIANDVATPIVSVFAQLFELKFPIHSIRPAYEFNGNDELSMAANNTSAFNCRTVEGTSQWSEHARGKAIDLNPLTNPYIKGNVVLPLEGRPYLDRNKNLPTMIQGNSPVVKAFETIGWQWGGYWYSLKDYQHFSHNGR